MITPGYSGARARFLAEANASEAKGNPFFLKLRRVSTCGKVTAEVRSESLASKVLISKVLAATTGPTF